MPPPRSGCNGVPSKRRLLAHIDTRVNPTSTESTSPKPIPRDMTRILGDCRDIAIHRLLLSFTALLDRVGDMLIDRASRTDVREEQTACLEARDVLQ